VALATQTTGNYVADIVSTTAAIQSFRMLHWTPMGM
jgi:hypothetical protein